MRNYLDNALKTLRYVPWMAEVYYPVTLRGFRRLSPLFTPYTVSALLYRASHLLVVSWYKEVNRVGLCLEEEPPGVPSPWPLRWRRQGCLDVSLAMSISYLARKINKIIENLLKKIEEEFDKREVEGIRKGPPLSLARRNLHLISEVFRFPPRLGQKTTTLRLAHLMIKESERLLKGGRAGRGRGGDREWGTYYDQLLEFYVAYLLAQIFEERPRLRFEPGGVVWEKAGRKIYWEKKYSAHGCPVVAVPDVLVEEGKVRYVFECKLREDEEEAVREALHQAAFYKLFLSRNNFETKAFATVASSDEGEAECAGIKILKFKFTGNPFEDAKRHKSMLEKALKD